MLTKLKVSYQQSIIVQDYQTLAYVASQILGGSPSGETQAVPDDGVLRPKNVKELEAAMKKVFGRG